jgi:peptide deformylase
VLRYEDALEVTDPNAIIDYISSIRVDKAINPECLRKEVEKRIAEEGCFRISKDFGLLSARSRNTQRKGLL